MYDELLVLLSITIFPGVVFTIALALFTQYFVRKISGRLQKRMGPSYVGPIGILQPFYDVLKLVRVKEEVIHRYSMPSLAKLFGIIGIASGTVVMLMFPLSPIKFYGDYDFLVYIYFTSIWIPLSLILMSLSMPGPYTAIGVSRYLSFITLMEPAFFVSILTPLMITSRYYSTPYSILVTSMNIHKFWLNPLTAIPLALSLLSAIIVLQARAMYNPFNIPEAEQEIIAGYETEFSGPVLGLAIILHDVEVAVTAITIVYLILGGPYPFKHTSVQGILTLITKYLLVILTATIIRNAFGRYRLEQALKILLYALIIAILSLIITVIVLR